MSFISKSYEFSLVVEFSPGNTDGLFSYIFVHLSSISIENASF